jgi:hypothetical protein
MVSCLGREVAEHDSFFRGDEAARNKAIKGLWGLDPLMRLDNGGVKGDTEKALIAGDLIEDVLAFPFDLAVLVSDCMG